MTAPDPTSARWDWLLLAVLTATLASLARWAIAQPAVARSRYGPTLDALVHSSWLTHPLRLLHAVGIPACALYWQHALSAKGLGLKPLPNIVLARDAAIQQAPGLVTWLYDFGALGILTIAFAGLVLLGDRTSRRSRVSSLAPGEPRSWTVAVRESIIHQVRWAFYREPFVFAWGFTLGSWLGALPVILEALVSPTFWRSLGPGNAAGARATVIRAGLLVVSTLTYLATQNIWLAILGNIVLEWLVAPNTASGATELKTPSPPPA